MVSTLFCLIGFLHLIFRAYLHDVDGLRVDFASFLAPEFYELYEETFVSIKNVKTTFIIGPGEHASPQQVSDFWADFNKWEACVNMCKELLGNKLDEPFYKVYSKEYLNILKVLTKTHAQLIANTDMYALYHEITWAMPNLDWDNISSTQKESIENHWKSYQMRYNRKDFLTVELYKGLLEPFEEGTDMSKPDYTAFKKCFSKFVPEYVNIDVTAWRRR